MPAIRSARRPGSGWSAALAALALLQACGGGGSSGAPADPAPERDTLLRGDELPGIVLEVLAVEGGSGSGGFFQPGDRVSVRFRVAKSDGSPWGLGEFDAGRILLSGPSFNYQRVLAAQDDLATRAVQLSDGSYRYSFEALLPATYLAPYHDSPDFGPGDGELTGVALLDGTYTVGLTLAWDYTFEGDARRDSGEAVGSLLLGGSATLVEREVVTTANCNACHGELSAHEGLHRDLRVCVLCHTQGAEDLNGGVTPGVSVSSRVMFHKIHSGRHLPSVLGVSTLPDGTRTYTAPPVPYVLVSPTTGAHDYSDVGFPAWPNRSIALPRDFGYAALSDEAKAKDELVRSGVASCTQCHGDPDGAGPLAAPAQGETIYAQPTRAACGACHDDVLWDRPYDAGNLSIMPPQANDTICTECHEAEDDLVPSFSVRGGHEHPLRNRLMNPFLGQGIHLSLIAADDVGDADGFLETGERLALRIGLTEDSGAPVNPGSIGALHVLLSGPAGNPNLVHEVVVPRSLLVGVSPFDVVVPESIGLEFLGSSSAAAGELFQTQRTPLHTIPGQPTRVYKSGALTTITTLAAATPPPANVLTLADASGFARDDVVVLEPGVPGQTEFLRVQHVEGARVWFSSPHTPAYPSATRVAHPAGSLVAVVALGELAAGVDYLLDAPSGTVTELIEFGDGAAVVASYTSDFVLPASYPVSANGSPELGEETGEWQGRALVEGAYTLAVQVTRDFDYFAPGAITRYRAASEPTKLTIPVGAGPTAVPGAPIESGASCLACHQELYYHAENYRGFDTCIACHGNAGMEDRPQYVSANAPATPGVRTDFRELVHRIHRGAELPDVLDHVVVGSGLAPWPDDFRARTFEHVSFPRRPGGTAQCAVCHGASEAWKEPAPREHPDGPTVPSQAWRPVCGACHATSSAVAHMDVNTAPSGAESCATCHGVGREWNVELYHAVR